jgi:hypothetical protein
MRWTNNRPQLDDVVAGGLDGTASTCFDEAMDNDPSKFRQEPGSASDLLNGASAELRRLYTPKLVLSADAYDHHSSSLTPVLIVCMNLPPWLRSVVGLQHLAMLIPKSVKNVQVLLKPLLADLRELETDGMLVWDAVRAAERVSHDSMVRIYPGVTNTLADYRALASMYNFWQSPALVGACPHCSIRGYKCCNRTCYASGVWVLPPTDGARNLQRQWDSSFPVNDWQHASNELGVNGRGSAEPNPLQPPYKVHTREHLMQLKTAADGCQVRLFTHN